MRKGLYTLLERPLDSSWGRAVQLFLMSVIIVNITAFSLDTVASIHAAYGGVLELVEMVTVGIFAIELLLRYWAAGEDERYAGVRGRMRLSTNFYIIIDIIAILPYILSLFGVNLSFVRSLRLLRIFKLLRAAKVEKFLRVVRQVFVNERDDLLAVYTFIGIILLFLTIIVYFLENGAQPEVFSSIPQTLWWSVVTLTTIGYGDMYPVTALGRVFTVIITMLGIAFYAVPGSFLTVAIIKQIEIDTCAVETGEDKSAKQPS